MQQYNISILLMLFNRSDTAQKVFDQIKKVKPKRLFIASDGARENVPGERERCEDARNIVNQIDWECEVKTLFQEKNLGMLYGPVVAINWFFENAEEGIIFEHDCVPSVSFFYFCEMMLEKYRNDERVMHIGGSNFMNGMKVGNGSYFFSKFNLSWGWATWRRAWKYFDPEMANFPEFSKNNLIKNIWVEREKARVFNKTLERVYKKELIAWDYVWTYTIWSQGGLAILPNVNLISNIGFGPHATHTQKKTSFMDIPIWEMGEIVDPIFVFADYNADDYIFHKVFKAKLINKITNKARNVLKKIYV